MSIKDVIGIHQDNPMWDEVCMFIEQERLEEIITTEPKPKKCRKVGYDKRYVDQIQVKCDFCDNLISLTPKREIWKRSRTKFGTLSCSRICSGKLAVKNDPERFQKLLENANLKLTFELRSKISTEIQERRRDSLSPFRVFLNGSRKKETKEYGTITLQHLKDVWDAQQGICALTGVKMEIRSTTLAVKKSCRTPLYGASLDRIDSNVGYDLGNVQFVCKGANLMKNNHTNQEALLFIQMIKEAKNA